MTPKQRPFVIEIVNALTEETKSGNVKWTETRNSGNKEFYYECSLSGTKIQAKVEVNSNKSIKVDNYSHWITINDPKLSESIRAFDNGIIEKLIKEIYDQKILPEKIRLEQKDEQDLNILKGIANKTGLQYKRESKLGSILESDNLLSKVKNIFK